MARVVLAMSGGVDSSVAAHLLLQQGHEVIGVFMRHGEESVEASSGDESGLSPLLPFLDTRADHKQGCCSAADAADARRVADQLGIAFYALNLQADFSRIIDYFVDEYSTGRTPNPCVMCNNWIKFGRLFDYADGVSADYVATGHYARLVPGDDPEQLPGLYCGRDQSKDQSYVLFGIDRCFLSRMLLPVGGYQKKEIRALASQLGYGVADKRDSQEICFVTSGDHGEFVRARRTETDLSGQIVTSDGRLVGEHPGIEQFTIGQRKGLGVGLGKPYYVVRIDVESRQVVIGQREELQRTRLTANRTNWLVSEPAGPFRCQAQIRYNSRAQAATAELLSDACLQIDFDQPVEGVAAGQAVVCYQQQQVLGGGWIC